MFPIILARGTAVSFSGPLGGSQGSRQLSGMELPEFVAGTPLFLQRGDPPITTECLGRAKTSDGGGVTFAWSLASAVAETATLRQPADWIVLPSSLRPLLHTEFRMGMVERPTAAGSRVVVQREEAVELLRVRLPEPPERVLARLLAFVQGMLAAHTLLLTVVDDRRRVRRAALADERLEIRPEEYLAGEPFDLILRIDGEGLYA